ncbi:MAG: flavodoxin family protein [Planctomycetota bacterium]
MSDNVSRRVFLHGATVSAASLGTASALAADEKKPPDGAAPAAPLRLLGIACSPRKGKTTASAVAIALEAAKAVHPERITTELIELADYEIPGYVAAGVPLKPNHQDDFPKLEAKLSNPRLAGIIVGTPVYFGCMSSLCKAMLDRLITLRKTFVLSNKAAGVVAVGGSRNGGQELTIQAVQASLMCHEMLVVGDGRPTAHRGATVWNQGDDISQDDFGVSTLKNLGRRVGEVAQLRLQPRG